MKGMISFGRRAADDSTAADWVEIANRCGTDQGPYMYYFWEHLRHLQSKPFTLMEIGVYQGGSLATWKKLFPIGHRSMRLISTPSAHSMRSCLGSRSPSDLRPIPTRSNGGPVR